MNKLIKFTGYILALSLMLIAPIAVYAGGCHKPKQGPPGPQGPAGPPGPPGLPFISTFGTWFIPNGGTVFVAPTTIIPFSNNEVSSGIINSPDGTFTFTSTTGVYQATFGISPQETGDIFDFELNGVLLPGGSVVLPPQSSPQVVTVMFTAAAGNNLVIRNNGPNTVVIGGIGDTGVATYISILQIN